MPDPAFIRATRRTILPSVDGRPWLPHSPEVRDTPPIGQGEEF